MSLANDYRPKDWDDVVEQGITTTILRNLCNADKLSCRNFLLTGPAGCGKTSLARLMSNKINNGEGEVIEVDAASHSGAEATREIVEQAKIYPMMGRYKNIIIDECFTADTLISTMNGDVPISQIHLGDEVYNLDGLATVTNVFSNQIPKTHLVKLHMSNGCSVITTKGHLFFTDQGWVCADSLQRGDMLYDYKTMCDLWSGVPVSQIRQSKSLWSDMRGEATSAEFSTISCELQKDGLYERMSNMWQDFLHSKVDKCYNLFSEVFRYLEETTRSYTETEREFIKAQARIYLSDMRQIYADFKTQGQENLLFDLYGKTENFDNYAKETCESIILCSLWRSVLSKIQKHQDVQPQMQGCVVQSTTERKIPAQSIRVYETSQPNAQAWCIGENVANQGTQRYLASAYCESWRQWFIYSATTDSTSSVRRELGDGISCENSCTTVESDALSYIVQSRPRICRYADSDRGGWCIPLREVTAIARRKENGLFGTVRVESIEVYKQGSNEQSFRSSFKDTECDSEYVTLYDLEVRGHSSYYANGVLVHNCHSLSGQGWQVLLKTLEESPARTVFFLCTTNPEKIPKTILSRVQQFQLSKISLDGIEQRIKYVLDSEIAKGRDISYTPDGINFIAKLAQGGMRDALTQLDTVLAFSNQVTSETVAGALNLSNYDDYFALLSAVAKHDNKAIVDIIDTVYNSGVNFIKWFEDFNSFVMNIIKHILLQDIGRTMIPSQYEDKLSKYTMAHYSICLRLSNVLMTINSELRTTNYLQETVLARLCTLPPKTVNKG